MPKNLNPSPELEHAPQIKRRPERDSGFSSEFSSQALGYLEEKTNGLSTWTPQKTSGAHTHSNFIDITVPSKPRPAVPYLPFIVVLIERLGSLDIFFKGLQWNQSRRVPMIKSTAPWWPIALSALAAILLSGRSWWAPWPIMSIFGAGFGWLISQSLARKEYCGGTACQQSLSKSDRVCPRCGGDVVR